MSIEAVKNAVIDFLKDDEPEVLAISGPWGCGKTYAWDKWIKNNKDSIAFKTYSYVSLFGLNSLEAIKTEIGQSLIDTPLIGAEAKDIELFKKKKLGAIKFGIQKGRSWLNNVQDADGTLGNIKKVADKLAFKASSKTLICIDDLERLSANLDYSDVMGLISQLKDQMGCKIVIVLNENQIEREKLAEFKKQKDKVVDREFLFDPTVKECAEIAFTDCNFKTDYLIQCCIRLNIKNIRILQRIKKAIELTYPLLKDQNPRLLEIAIHRLVLFINCKYSEGDEKVPAYSLVTRKYNEWDDVLRTSENDKRSQKEKYDDEYLTNYGYRECLPYDKALLKIIDQGFVIEEEFTAIISDNESILSKEDYQNEYSNLTEELLVNVNIPSADIITKVVSFIKENVKNVNINQLELLSQWLGELGATKEANEMIKHFFTNRDEDYEFYDISSYESFKKIQNTKIIEKMNIEFTKRFKAQSFDEIATISSLFEGSNDEKLSKLETVNIESWVQLIKSKTNEDRRKIYKGLKDVISFKNSGNEKANKICLNICEALNNIADENEINKWRVEKVVQSYGFPIFPKEEKKAIDSSE